MARTLTYSQFTPPWIRRCITVQPENPIDANGDNEAESATLKRIALMHLRNERNTQGYRRVRFVLAAFFRHEPNTVKPLIEQLFQILPSRRAAPRRKTGWKRPLPNEASPQGGNRQKQDGSGRYIHKTTDNAENGEQASQTQLNALTTSQLPRNFDPAVSVQQESAKVISNHEKSPEDTSDVIMTPQRALLQSNRGTQLSPRLLPQHHQQIRRIKQAALQKPKKTSVFDGLLPKTSQLEEGRHKQANGTAQSMEPSTIQVIHNAQTSSRAPAQAEESENPLTIFTPDASLHVTEESGKQPGDDFDPEVDKTGDYAEDDDDELSDPRDGSIKCGALARCIFVLNHDKQTTEHTNAACKDCKYQMHRRCSALHVICDQYEKKKYVLAMKKHGVL